MAELKKLRQNKVKASSLLEVMVALVIVFTVFAVSMNLYINLVRSSASLQQTKALIMLNKAARQTAEKKEYIDGKMEIEGISIERTVTSYSGMDEFFVIKFMAFDIDNKPMGELKEIVHSEK